MLPFDFYAKLKRGPAVILPKDGSAIIGRSGLSPGDRVAEAGSGSGWLTVQLANAVGPTGKVYSFEKREEFLEFAQKNVKRCGFTDRVEFRLADMIAEGPVGLSDLDLVVFDFAESDKATPHAFKALKAGGVLVGYLPTVEQAKAFVMAAHAAGFSVDRVVTCAHDEWAVRPFGVRPEHMQLAFTAFLAFLRKPPLGEKQRPLEVTKARPARHPQTPTTEKAVGEGLALTS